MCVIQEHSVVLRLQTRPSLVTRNPKAASDSNMFYWDGVLSSSQRYPMPLSSVSFQHAYHKYWSETVAAFSSAKPGEGRERDEAPESIKAIGAIPPAVTLCERYPLLRSSDHTASCSAVSLCLPELINHSQYASFSLVGVGRTITPAKPLAWRCLPC